MSVNQSASGLLQLIPKPFSRGTSSLLVAGSENATVSANKFPYPCRLRPCLLRILSSEDSERFVSPGTFSFVLSFYLLALLTGSPLLFFVVIVGCPF